MSAAAGLRQTGRRLRAGPSFLHGFSGHIPESLVVAPQDLHTTDPTRAEEFYRGSYVLAGKSVEAGGTSPFLLNDVDPEWRRVLHEFHWIRHLSASEDSLANTHARAMVTDWVEHFGRSHDEQVWNVETVSRRLISLLSHSVQILTGAEYEFYRLFMRSLGAHVRFLRRHGSSAPDGMPRLMAQIALNYALVCHSGQRKSLASVKGRLDAELDRQIYSDGGHVSRNPALIIEILALLLPLRQSIIAIGETPSASLLSSIERMFPALRFFRMGDGSIARFNNAGASKYDLIATLLRYDEALGQPSNDASQSGYQRMVKGNAIVLQDTGEPPTGELSATAHAGCLSFEFSDGLECFVVNCGVPESFTQNTKPLWRSTAAHSTAVFNETSSCKFDDGSETSRYLGGQVFLNQLKVASERKDTNSGCHIAAQHRGYYRDFGFCHHRDLMLLDEGKLFQGKERFVDLSGEPVKYATHDDFAIRFHLHPDVELLRDKSSGGIVLRSRSGAQWQFTCDQCSVDVEESIFFPGVGGSTKAVQIVLRGLAVKTPEVDWVFRKLT